MAASTKLVLLVVALLLGVSILFYGVMFDGESSLDVTEPAVLDGDQAAGPASGEDGDADSAARGEDRRANSLAAGAANPAERPALGASARRPSLSGTHAPAPREETARPALGGAERRPLAAARPTPGQIEMGAGRGPLAGGTRLPGASPTPAGPEADPQGANADADADAARPRLGAAGPVARSEPSMTAAAERPPLAGSRPALGGSSPDVRSSGASDSPPARPTASESTTSRPDPADILVSRYTIRKGDTLSLIAARHLGEARHWPLIRDANPGLDVTRLQVGQQILLPPRSASARAGGDPAPATAPATPTPDPVLRPGERLHEVRSGDTLSSIAAAHLGAASRWRLIADRNQDLLGGDPNRLAVGMKLRIPPKPGD